MVNIKIDSEDYFDYLKNAMTIFDTNLMWEIGNEIVNFSKDAFTNQGWTDTFFEAWETVEDKNGMTLIETGALRNSITIKSLTDYSVVVGSDLQYAAIHNDGGVIKVTDKMKRFFWSRYKSTGSEKWRRLALSKRVTMPKRTFLGPSEVMNKKIEKIILDKWEEL